MKPALYPGHMRENTSKDFELNPAVPVTRKTPPTFLPQAQDDDVGDVENSLVYYTALKEAFLSRCICIRTAGMPLACEGRTRR
jgi:hypothetical protein